MKRILTLVALVFLCGSLLAQTTSNGVSASSDVVAVWTSSQPLAGSNWQVGNVTKAGYDLFDYGATKTNHVYVESTIFTVPSLSVSYYAGGAAYQPDISKLFTHLNAPAGSFNFFLDGGVGVLNTTVNSISQNQVAGHLGAAVKYNFSKTVTWNTLRGESLFTPGQPTRFGLSTGLTAFFGKTGN